LLSLFLTGSPDRAEDCFVGGIGEAIKGNYVFKERARSWAPRTIVQSAIRLIAPLHYTRPNGRNIDVTRDLDRVPVTLHAEVRAILDLAPLERFSFVLSVLERYSDNDCSILLGCGRRDVLTFRTRVSVTRSIVFQVVGPCKTEASQKPVPLDSRLADALKLWRDQTKYCKADDWVFASPAARGRKPYWGQCLMRTIIRPAASKIGITQHIGWHSFRHTYSSLLRANKTDIKVTQELLHHASSRVTLDTYAQAVTIQKRRAQSSVIRLLEASAKAAG